MSSRDKIVTAAVAMMKQDANARLSVRAVATQAGVSTGTLRHFFPTQRQLQDTVLASIFDTAFPDGNVHDQSIPARERLMQCLWHMLASVGSVEESREIWSMVFDRYITSDATDAARENYIERIRLTLLRIEYWLTVLSDEGAIPHGNNSRRARFLLTVVNGLLLERVLPTEGSLIKVEAETLSTAVEAVFGDRG